MRRTRKQIIFICSLCLFFSSFQATSKEELRRINDQIEELREEKRGYEARALYHDSVAERLQFVDGELLSARRHFKLADQNRMKAAEKQIEIERLKEKRKQLLQGKAL